uniref:CD247 molecule n=1 Tax=Moschus moschiferus TaxID=68415 RepID=A0A8C6DUN7_MOSMO
PGPERKAGREPVALRRRRGTPARRKDGGARKCGPHAAGPAGAQPRQAGRAPRGVEKRSEAARAESKALALLFPTQFSRSADAPAGQQGQNPVYNELNVGRREEYAVLDRRGGFDPEMGGKPQRKKNSHEVVYNELRKDKMAEAYSEIGMKSDNQRRRGKGNDGLYQGLSKATKDTYDALHMQALPPR